MATSSTFDVSAGPDRLIALPEVRRRTGNLHRVTIWRAIKDKTFPAPVIVGRRRLWVKDEVDGWIAARKADRDRAECLVIPNRPHDLRGKRG